MKHTERPFHILLYVRKTEDTVLEQLIEQLEKVYSAFHGFQILVCADRAIRISKPYIEQIEFQIEREIEEIALLQEMDLLLVENLDKSDLDVLLSMMIRQVPVLVEEKVAARYPDLFIPERTVQTYAHMHLVQLPMILTRFLRNGSERKRILQEAQAIALERRGPAGGRVILKEATLICEDPQEQLTRKAKRVKMDGQQREECKAAEQMVDAGGAEQLLASGTASSKEVRRTRFGLTRDVGAHSGFVGCGVLDFTPENRRVSEKMRGQLVYVRRMKPQEDVQSDTSLAGDQKIVKPAGEEGKSESVWSLVQQLLEKWGGRLRKPADPKGRKQEATAELDVNIQERSESGQLMADAESMSQMQTEVNGLSLADPCELKFPSPRPKTRRGDSISDCQSSPPAEDVKKSVETNPGKISLTTSPVGLTGCQSPALNEERSTDALAALNEERSTDALAALNEERSTDVPAAPMAAQSAVSSPVSDEAQTIDSATTSTRVVPTDSTTGSNEELSTVSPGALNAAQPEVSPAAPNTAQQAVTSSPGTPPSRTKQHYISLEKNTSSTGLHRKRHFAEWVDLVIISYNTLRYLRECLQTIRFNTQYPYRIIVVDNGSTDGSVEFLQRNPDIHLIANRENFGYAKACNQGITAGRGEFVVILNTDIKVYPGWLTRLVDLAKSDETIGIIGPKMINEHGQIVGAGVTELSPVCSSRGWLQPDHPELFAQIEDCYSVGGACYLIRREALTKVGLFDERFFFYFEETDLSLRMVEKGYRVVYCPQVSILHYHEGSLDQRSRLERLKRNQYFERSQKRFGEKWNAVINGALRRPGNRDIVVFGLIPWHFRYQRPQQVCSRLAESGYRVLYMNNTCQYGGHLEQIKENLYAYSPDGNAVVYQLLNNTNSRTRLIQSITEVLRELKMEHPILWVDVPYWEKVLPYFDRQFLIYSCMDAYADFADLRIHCPEILQMEEEVARAADLTFVSSRLLQERLRKIVPEVHLIPNGAESAHFQLERALPVPSELTRIPQPVIGYYGAIAEWFDLDLLQYVIRRLPQYSFVLIGEHTVEISELQVYPNVYFLGEKPYAELPGYLKQFQVAMIPFKKTELTLSTNPVKLYEYLSAGKPVVSVDLPEIREFASVVRIAKDYEEFVHLLQDAVEHDGPLEREKRRKTVMHEDWQDRVNTIIQLIVEKDTACDRQSGFVELARQRKEREV